MFEAYIRALSNDFTFVGDIVTVTASMRTFLSQVDVDSINFTVTDPSLFVDRVLVSIFYLNKSIMNLACKDISPCYSYSNMATVLSDK